MKRIYQHPPETQTGRKYWRSLNEYAETPEFQDWLSREFPPGAAEFEAGGVSRRSFIKLMSASMALAGLGMAGCRRPEGFIVPYTKSVEWVIPGKALYYASAMPRRNGAVPMVVSTYEGRPTHLDGNRLLPDYQGGLDPVAQASILDLYDPDRSWRFLHEGKPIPKELFGTRLEQITKSLAQNGGQGAAILLEESSSPTRERLLNELQEKFPQLTIATYDPIIGTRQRDVMTAHFGEGTVLRNDYSAKRILSLDCDFLGIDEPAATPNQQFAAGRKLEGDNDPAQMSRLYTVEANFTITGGMADHRLRLAPSQVYKFAAFIAGKLGVSVPGAGIDENNLPFDRKWAEECAKDLQEHQGESLVAAGPRQPAAVQELVLMINEALGNLGKTVRVLQTGMKNRETLEQLINRINGDEITQLFLIGGNPAYSAPSDLKFKEVMGKVEEVIRLGYFEDETTQLATWHVPSAHYLESWGDDVTAEGTYVPVQPMIAPLNGGISEWDLLALLNGRGQIQDHAELKTSFTERVPNDVGEEKWSAFLKEGYLPDSKFEEVSAGGISPRFLAEYEPVEAPGKVIDPTTGERTMEVEILPDPTIEDGRYNNNGWLQELPDPVTKLTWDNAALISPKTAKYLAIDPKPYHNLEGKFPMIRVSVEGREVAVPAHILPGHADDVVTLYMGYGRESIGRVGKGTGFNVMPLVTAAGGQILPDARVTLADDLPDYGLAFAQMFSYMEGRALVREGLLEEYQKKPEFAQKLGMDSHIPPNVSLYKTPPYGELAIHQWGMTIDLHSCTGCNACVVACQSENNIPIVGKIQVQKGREMHWIRLDRYFATTDYNEPLEDSEPQMIVQPVACVHCENAPCETVCPVNATVHSEDGLNVMAYNRCIGTRYCANNCPYKARRFNFFDYNDRPKGPIQEGPLKGADKLELGPLTEKGMADSLEMVQNPNVTVRMRGVMEKCTYCVQRIETAKIHAKVNARDSDNVRVPANTVRVACQDACPSDAIDFGDLANTESTVVEKKLNPRNYRIIEYLNTQARTSYLARVRNPNKKMPDFEVAYADKKPKARHHYDHHHAGEHKEGHQGHPTGDDHGVVPPKSLEHAAEGSAPDRQHQENPH